MGTMDLPATCMVLAIHVTYPRFSFNGRKVIRLTDHFLKVSLVLEMKRSCIVSNLEWLIFMSLANLLCGFLNTDCDVLVHMCKMETDDTSHILLPEFGSNCKKMICFTNWLHHMNPCIILRTLRRREVSGNQTKNISGYYQCWSGVVFFLIPFRYL